MQISDPQEILVLCLRAEAGTRTVFHLPKTPHNSVVLELIHQLNRTGGEFLVTYGPSRINLFCAKAVPTAVQAAVASAA